MDVRKIDNISHKEFVEQFVIPGIPVVLKNASKVWKANGLFTPDYFRQNFGDRRTVVKGIEYTMREIMDMVEASSVEHPAPYPCKYSVPSQLPELLPLLSPLNLGYAALNYFDNRTLFPTGKWGNEVELFIGGYGGKFPVAHLDFYHTNAWITQLYGAKNFIVFPRGQDKYLYPVSDSWTSDVDIFNPDYEKHPDYKKATPITVTVEPGETIFVPNGIWHTAESLTPSISIIFDQVTSSNYDAWFKDIWDEKKQGNKVKAAALMAYLRGAKAICDLSYAIKSK